MPYPNEHSCRLREPIDGAPTRRVNGEREHDGKKYDVIYQKTGGSWEEQAYRYPSKDWTVGEAREHCKEHKGIRFEPAEGEGDDGKACVACGELAGRQRRLSSNVADWTSRPWAIHRARLDAMSRRLEAINLAEPRVQDSEIKVETEEDPGYAIADGVAIVEIVGDIWKEVPWLYSWSGCAATSTLEVRGAIERAEEDPEAEAILLRIDSPGGIIDGVQELADAIFEAKLRGKKPVHAYIEDLGASAAYWIASQASRISANMTAQVGSIGVYSVILDDSKKSEREGLRFHVIRSGKYKGTGAGAEISDEELVPYQEVVDDLAGMFASDVARGRGISEQSARDVATGRTWTAPKARSLGLIDAIESLETAIAAARGKEDASTAQAAYACECLECGHVMESDKHCREISCPKCGGAMRRKERPGPGNTAADMSHDLAGTTVGVALEDHSHRFSPEAFSGSGIEWSAGTGPVGFEFSETEGNAMAEGEKTGDKPVLTADEILASYPEAVESWRAEGREEGKAEGKKEAADNLRALSEALPGRPEAVLKAALEGLGPIEAKARLADELAAENAELKKKAAAVGADGGEPVSASDAPATSPGSDDFISRSKALAKEKTISLSEAMSSLAKEDPELFKAYKAGLRK